jgi:tetratricopeptide (TPR) repeat protein
MPTPPQPRWAKRIFSGARTKIFRRPIYIFWLSLLAVAFFSFTFFVNRLYAQRQKGLSVYWFRQGENELLAGNPSQAISDLRTALLYSHDNQDYLFALAQALEADGQLPEARSYFLGLLEDEPGNGSVNLELARLAEKENDVNHAMRYFNGAIYGAWYRDAVRNRQRARQELISFLIAKNLKTQARGELLSFTAEMPKTPDSQLWVAQAFSHIGDDRSASEFYRYVLRSNRHSFEAMKGAGLSAFRLGNYREALEYFKRAAAVREDEDISRMIELASLVLELNPFESNIPENERRHRLILAMDVADKRLRQCAQVQHVALDATPPNPLQSLRSQWIDLDNQIRRARNDADLVQLLTPLATLLNRVEQQNGCGPSATADEAMLRIYQNPTELQP